MAEPVEHDQSWAISADACFHPTDAFIGRVQRAYRLATARVPRWVSFGPEAEKLHQQLLSGGNETIRQIMTDPGTTHLYYGMDSLYPNGLSDEPQHARAYANGCASLVTNLAEAVGARRAHNPEAPGARANGNDLEALLADLDRHLGVKLAFPNPFPREIGLKTSRGIASVRAVYAIYQAWRLRELCRLTKGRKVLEIGAGTGRAAYYALCLGLDDYTIIDLPATLVASSCFLAAALGEGKIWMVGDPVEERAGRLRLLPATETGALPECFDVIVNVDSLPEMPREIAEEYFVEACSKSSAFLSINHEAGGLRVSDLPARLGRQEPVLRSKHWLRNGYVEEIFFRQNSDPSPIPHLRSRALPKMRWWAMRWARRVLRRRV
jgi:SAM-dependent methyltransferase